MNVEHEVRAILAAAKPSNLQNCAKSQVQPASAAKVAELLTQLNQMKPRAVVYLQPDDDYQDGFREAV